MGKRNKQKKKASTPKEKEPNNEESMEEQEQMILNESISEEKEVETNQSSMILQEEEEDEDDVDDNEAMAEVRAYQDVLLEKGKLSKNDFKQDNESETEEVDEKTNASTIALKQRLKEIESNNLSYMETLNTISTTPLPFKGLKDLVHDDLKREVIFYNTALESVQIAKTHFVDANVPFTRPQDFYTEMIKTDDHMRKVKDRLVFESKKINAFEQRKTNRETKLRSKENKNKALETKNEYKREHFRGLKSWEKDSKGRGSGAINDGDDEGRFKRFFDNGDDNNPKRRAADRRYGSGAGKKKGHFKQADKKALNDFSDFKKNNKKGKGASSSSGDKRPGKRARDSKRQKRN